jgi:serine/threonine protein kinase
VLDFGIAKLLDSHRDSGALKTRTGLIIGSPGYMAPERIKAAELTPSSDLYSLGILFAEMLKGRPLYEDMTPVEILANNLGGRPLPIPPEVRSSSLGGIIDQATQYEPNMRFQTAADMMAALDRAAAMAEGGGEDLAFAMEPTAHMVLPAGALDRKKLKRAGGGQGGQRASLWSNPINIILAVLILVLVVATVVILLVN